MAVESADGGCACGAIRYRVEGRPLVSSVCHCRTCRRTAGAPLVPWVTFPAARFALLRGKPGELRSSPPVVRTFCRDCGTPLTYVHSDRPAELDVTACSLDDPDAFPPTHHGWGDHRVKWLRLDDGLPVHAESEPRS
jgi:hypothetical protein